MPRRAMSTGTQRSRLMMRVTNECTTDRFQRRFPRRNSFRYAGWRHDVWLCLQFVQSACWWCYATFCQPAWCWGWYHYCFWRHQLLLTFTSLSPPRSTRRITNGSLCRVGSMERSMARILHPQILMNNAIAGLIRTSAFLKAMGQNCDHKQILLGTDRHIVHFPVRNGNVMNIVRFCLQFVWPWNHLMYLTRKVGFVRDPEHLKLGNHTGPWAEKRPKAEMLRDFDGFTEDCLTMLSVCWSCCLPFIRILI